MKDNYVKKGLVVSVILLFIGVTVAPSINFNVVKASNDNDLVEVTTQACGINGYGNTTVRLTKQQSEQLQHFMDDIISRLNNASTYEEAKAIFYHALQRFKEDGLISRETNIKILQHLLTNTIYSNRNLPMMKIPSSTTKTIIDNRFCLMALKQEYIIVVSPMQMHYLWTNRYSDPYFNLGWLFFQQLDYLRHFFIGAQIRFGWGDEGTISTWSLFRNNYGHGIIDGLIHIAYPNGNNDVVGVTGFTGIRIMPKESPWFAFGMANMVLVEVS